jgi:hypothetical protein
LIVEKSGWKGLQAHGAVTDGVDDEACVNMEQIGAFEAKSPYLYFPLAQKMNFSNFRF